MARATCPQDYDLYVGGDIAAETVTVAWLPRGGQMSAPLTLAQTAPAYVQLQQRFQALGVAPARVLVVVEATSTYWLAFALAMHQAGYGVSVINPSQAHHFARALLKRDKTDAIDAQTLSQLAARLEVPQWQPPPEVYAQLQQRLAQRESLITMRQQVRNQRHALEHQPEVVEPVQARMTALEELLTAQIAEIEAELAQVAEQPDEAWATTMRRLMTIPGVGLMTAVWLVVATFNFSLCTTPDEVTAYAGLAPRQHLSGTSVRGRASLGHTGHARLRTALYLASLSATRHNPLVKAFYDRLTAAGKAKKVARCAAARKLLHIAWAVATKQQAFDPNYGQPSAAQPVRA